jgi:hypothetical protein
VRLGWSSVRAAGNNELLTLQVPLFTVKKVNQTHYRPGGAQRVQGS